MKKKLIFLSIFLLFVTIGCSKEKELKCPDEFILDGTICIKEIEHKEPDEVKYCPEGFELTEEICIKQEEETVKEKYECEEGLTVTGDKCTGTLKKTLETRYRCNVGTVKDDKCIISTEKSEALTKVAKCESGWNLENNKCLQGTMPPMGCDWENQDYNGCFCEGSDVLGNDSFCHKYKAPTYTYTCAEGTVLKNNKCYEESSNPAESYRTCPPNYEEKNNECIRNVNTSAKKVTYCSDGFELKNNKCLKETKEEIKVKYECSEGYEYKDNLCRKYEKELAN